MATQVENPFDTQQPKPAGLVAGAAYATDRPAVNQATETTSGQLNTILAGDSPLMQRARALASQQSNARGLLNSTMNAEAGTAAMIDRAVPIANADAGVYDTRARFNSDAENVSRNLGANIASQMNLQKGQQEFQGSQSELERQQQTNLQRGQQEFQGTQADRDRQLQTTLLSQQQGFQGSQADLDRQQQVRLADQQAARALELQESQQKFQEIQSQLDRTQQTDLTKLQATLSEAANKQNIPQTFAANLSLATQQSMTQILANGDMTPEAKRGAIDNLIAATNSQIAWASTFYGTPIPGITNPGGTGSTSQNSSLTSFNSSTYLAQNPDVAKDPYWSAHPEEHYEQHGRAEGRARPS